LPASDRISAPRPARAGITPMLARYPEPTRTQAFVSLELGEFAPRLAVKEVSTETRREEQSPGPHRSAVRAAAARTLGWDAGPR
jgi:hypothetical protein